jgi:hypothetical protein
MTKKNFQYLGIGLICLLIILSLGNPSPTQFKDYIGRPSFEHYSMIYKRTSNWLIFSTYEFSYESPIRKDSRYEEITKPLDNLVGTYSGFFLNFYKKDN